MEKYIPDIYQKSIYNVDYKKLYNCGIRCVLFDLDNTLAPINIKEPPKKVKELFDDLKEQGFKVIIFSNSHKARIKPFKENLNVDSCAFAFKPFKYKFIKVLTTYNFKQSEVVIIGDQMLTDIVGGNNVGITTILINPISNKDFVFTKFNRLREKYIMRKLRNNNLFVKGRYYE